MYSQHVLNNGRFCSANKSQQVPVHCLQPHLTAVSPGRGWESFHWTHSSQRMPLSAFRWLNNPALGLKIPIKSCSFWHRIISAFCYTSIANGDRLALDLHKWEREESDPRWFPSAGRRRQCSFCTPVPMHRPSSPKLHWQCKGARGDLGWWAYFQKKARNKAEQGTVLTSISFVTPISAYSLKIAFSPCRSWYRTAKMHEHSLWTSNW